MGLTRKITTCLLFSGQAAEAAHHYVGIFKDARIVSESPVLTVFTLEGQEFVALNGPDCEFTWGVSQMVSCETQAEVDHYWNALSAGGEELPCGWLTDKFGVAWQIVPTMMMNLMDDPDRIKADRAFQAMMTMKKLDIAALQKAYAGG